MNAHTLFLYKRIYFRKVTSYYISLFEMKEIFEKENTLHCERRKEKKAKRMKNEIKTVMVKGEEKKSATP